MSEHLLKVPHIERKKFKQHFLKGVVVAFWFNEAINNSICSLKEIELSTFFKELGYDNFQEIKNKSFKITLDNDETQAEPSTETVGSTYINSQNNNQIQIINERFIFVQNEYEDFDVLIEHVIKIVECLFSRLDASVVQIGFRKINSIVCSEITSYNDITDLFNETLFNFIKSDLFSFEDLENYRDNFTLSKNGTKCIINTACNKILNLNNSYEITIDTDIINKDIYRDNSILNILKEINQMHFDLFCWMASDKLREIMNKGI